MPRCVRDIALSPLLDEELPSDEQRSGENEREHRGRELTGILHRTSFSVIGSNGERGPTIDSSCTPQIKCHFIPNRGAPRRNLNN
ncbi:hypothetical protein BJA01nite_06610 [Bradyrhizobium japonicum]|jgi:hypothetical protein|nr:hypothetical protein BJ6T_57880 [Bradyrhizobium japonicum USDA 6]GEC43019.1 hypothetical protein BJA01nite_06610 [Bradyrhizobium japonicum]